ncbi:sucrose-phosphate phosphatase [Nostoc sp. LPT]|uniref:sucrose-phosphate phosphatase n=1 Tax=Nostoc sp. LPT TaxID=2815387 RepID=UPI001D4281C6|nr:sucrose-phosphate phosphatase [Nostoc sp. LPT]MBN4003467.1 sucrose-phosphate phosphatase [Nostoc sp. LPT]
MRQFLLVTDLDYTLVGDDQAMARLNQRLEQHRQQHHTKIVYSTGRSLFLYQKLIDKKALLEPDVLICAVGTEIYYSNSNTLDSKWSDYLSEGWDRDLVVNISKAFSELKPQPNTEQRPFKVSYFLEEEKEISGNCLSDLESRLLKKGLDIQVICSLGSSTHINNLDNNYKDGKDLEIQVLDILPRKANKGMAMTFVRENLEIDVAQTVACGDSGNDIALFADKKEKGIIVGNAKQELLKWHEANPNPNRYLAKAQFAAGIEEGLQYFGFFEG